MKIEIWSDVVCPWCYIGVRNLERALESFAQRDQVEITWRSFELDPNAEKISKVDSYDRLAAKYGVSRDQSKKMHADVTNKAAMVGLTYNMDLVQPSNSFDAHRLVHIAASHGMQDKVMKKLFSAYFTEGLHISTYAVLAGIAKEAGLNGEEVLKMLEENKYAAEVRAEENEAQRLGIRGVPYFLMEGKYAISGAQPPEVFLQSLEKVQVEQQQ